MSNTTIKANLSVSEPDVLFYKGQWYKLQHFHDGKYQPLAPGEMRKVRDRFAKILQDAERTTQLGDLNLAVFHLGSKKLHVWNKGEDWNSHAKTVAEIDSSITQNISDIILGTVVTPTSSNSGSSTSTPSSTSTTSPAATPISTSSGPSSSTPSGAGSSWSDWAWNKLFGNANGSTATPSASDPNLFPAEGTPADRRQWIVDDFNKRHGRDLSEDALKIYARFLMNGRNNADNHMRITDTVTSREASLVNNQIVQQAIRAFGEDNYDRVYIPFNVPGHFCLIVLDRTSNSVIAYDSLGNPRKSLTQLATYLQTQTGLSQIRMSSGQNAHQRNNLDCGIYVLHFIEQMERGTSAEAILAMNGRDINTASLRARYAQDIQTRAPNDYFEHRQGEIFDLDRLNRYHLDRLKERKDQFVGEEELRKIHTAQLMDFYDKIQRRDWEGIRRSHFDWWMFPIQWNSRERGNLYNIDDATVASLRADDDDENSFMVNYRRGVWAVFASWGWDIAEERPHSNGQRWDGNVDRLDKIIRSLQLFGERELLQKVYRSPAYRNMTRARRGTV